MARLTFFKTGRTTPIFDGKSSSPSPIRKTPLASCTTLPTSTTPVSAPLKARDFALPGPSPVRPPRPQYALYDEPELRSRSAGDLLAPIRLERKVSHVRSTSCPLSALACDDRSPSSRPVSPPSPSPAPQRIDSKRRPPALTLLVSNLTTEPPSSKRDAGSMEELRDTPSQPPKSLPKPTSRQANPFQNIPLPWSLVPTSSVSPTSLLQYQDASPPSPRFLPSHILATCQSESKRLTSELDRLTRKYAKLVEQRDETLRQIQLEPAAVVRIARTLEKQISRCDRVARQMYVCNDQIRQMECQMAEHRVGVWRVGREGRQGEENREGRRDEGGKQIGRDWGRTGPNEGEDRGGRSQTTAEHISAEALDFEGELSPNVILILPPRQYMAEDDVPDPSTPVDHHTAPLRIKPLRSDRCRSMIETSRAPRVKQAVRESRWDTSILLSLATADLWART